MGGGVGAAAAVKVAEGVVMAAAAMVAVEMGPDALVATWVEVRMARAVEAVAVLGTEVVKAAAKAMVAAEEWADWEASALELVVAVVGTAVVATVAVAVKALAVAKAAAAVRAAAGLAVVRAE